MGVRICRVKGSIVGYQALGGAGKTGASRYFSVAKYGAAQALQLAKARSLELQGLQPPRRYEARGANAGGLPGLRFEFRDSEAVDGAPFLYVVATGGRKITSYSANKHGKLGAIELAIKARERALGRSLGLTPRQALARMNAPLQG